MIKPANYQIRVTSPVTGDVAAFIPLVNAFGLKYSIERNKITSYALTLPYEDSHWNAFGLDAIVDIMRQAYDGTFYTEGSYLTRFRQRLETENDERLVVSGWHVNHLLKRRYVDPNDDSVQPNGGYATKSGEAATIIRAYIREQAADLASVDRQMEGLSVPIPSDSSIDLGDNLRYENLWEQMIKLANVANLDIEVRHNGSRDFEVFIGRVGSDKSINSVDNLAAPYTFTIFSPNLGNFSEPSYTEDFKESVTYVRVGGSGARENRSAIELPSSDISLNPYNRIENTADARNTKDGSVQTLYTSALRYLEDNRGTINFDGTIVISSGGAIYRQNWVLGDVITMQWGIIEKDLRITKIEFEAEDTDEDLKIEVTNADE